MKRTTKHVALDVYQATTVASVRDDSGRVLARGVLKTHGPSTVEFLCGMHGALHVGLPVMGFPHHRLALPQPRTIEICMLKRVAQ